MALARSPSNTFVIISAAAVVEDPTTSKNIIIIINQAVYFPDLEQHESLLHTDQARAHYVHINDLAKCFHDPKERPGHQDIEVEG
jgi:hypothetical protein